MLGVMWSLMLLNYGSWLGDSDGEERGGKTSEWGGTALRTWVLKASQQVDASTFTTPGINET